MNRASIILGAAKCVFNAPAGAATFYSAAGKPIKLDFTPETFDIGAEGFSQKSKRLKDAMAKLSVTPEGRWSSAIIAAFWPFANATAGQQLFNNTDRTFLLHDSNSHLYTLASTAITKCPQLLLSPVKSLIGELEITGLHANNSAYSDANPLFTQAASGGTFTDSTFSNSLIPTQPYLATWGSVTGFANMETFEDEGFTFTPTIKLKPLVLSGNRTYNYVIEEIGAEVSFRPATPTQAQLLTNLALQGTGIFPGKELGTGADLTITGVNDAINYCILKNCVLTKGGVLFGATEYRNDVFTLTAQPNFSSGVPTAQYVLAAS